MKALKLIDSMMENTRINDASYDDFENAKHVAESYDEKIDMVEEYLITIFLNSVKRDPFDEKQVRRLIENIIALHDYGQTFSPYADPVGEVNP